MLYGTQKNNFLFPLQQCIKWGSPYFTFLSPLTTAVFPYPFFPACPEKYRKSSSPQLLVRSDSCWIDCIQLWKYNGMSYSSLLASAEIFLFTQIFNAWKINEDIFNFLCKCDYNGLLLRIGSLFFIQPYLFHFIY